MSAEKTYRPYQPAQPFLLPPALQDWLPEGHLAYFVDETVEHLDLTAIRAVYEDEPRGAPPYHPALLVKVLLYGYCKGVPSSRKLQTRCVEDVAFRVLAANQTPDFRTISDFRKRHLQALKGLFVQVLRLCQKAGLVKLGHVSLDGTKLKANASKHKAMSYAHMQETEARLQREVDALLKQAEAVDAAEDRQYGPDRRGDELPAELARRESRLAKIREAKAALEAEAKAAAQAAGPPPRPRRGPTPKPLAPAPAPKAQRNFTDPESRIMPSSSDKGAFVQAYNAQVAVDGHAQVIVACAITQQTTDTPALPSVVEQLVANTGAAPQTLSADAGYFSEANVQAVEALHPEPCTQTEAFIAVARVRHGHAPPPAPRGRIPTGLSLRERMRRKLRTVKGKRCYAKRKAIVEPVIGQIKQARGFRQFLLRGVTKVQTEWSLICTTHNLLKLWQAGALATA